MIVASLIQRPVSFLIAEKSLHKPIIGDFARATGALPVIRPQDRAREVPGAITAYDAEGHILVGSGTAFMKDVVKGELVMVKGYRSVAPITVVDVLDDARLLVKPPVKPEDEADGTGGQPAQLDIKAPATFKVIPRIDQSEVFAKVHQGLVRVEAVGIFPEGGSSDRTDLLPLKAGVSVMALGAADLGANVLVVPFGLNYFNAHRWRSRVLVDVGEPIPVSAKLLEQFRRGEKREAYGEFLKVVETGLRSVTFNAPDFKTMQLLRAMRRMYQGDVKLKPKRYMELNRRFAFAFAQFKSDERFIALVENVSTYLGSTEKLGLTDRIVSSMPQPGGLWVTLRACAWIVWIFALAVLALIVSLLPLVAFGALLVHINRVVAREMDKAVKGSTVKVKGTDVAASQKVLTAVAWAPVTIIFWTVVTAVVFGTLWPGFAASVAVANPVQAWWLSAVVWIAPLAFFFGIIPVCYLAMLLCTRTVNNFNHLKMYLLLIEGFARDNSRASNVRAVRKELALKVQDFFEVIVIPAIPEWQADPVIDRAEIVKQRRHSDQKRALMVASEIASIATVANDAASPDFEPKDKVRKSLGNIDAAALRHALDRDVTHDADDEEDEPDEE